MEQITRGFAAYGILHTAETVIMYSWNINVQLVFSIYLAGKVYKVYKVYKSMFTMRINCVSLKLKSLFVQMLARSSKVQTLKTEKTV